MTEYATQRMTLYHLVGLPKLRSAIRDDRDDFAITEFEIAEETPALCVQFENKRRIPNWGRAFESLTTTPVNVGNISSGAILIISDSVVNDVISAWAITFGQGFHYLDEYYIDRDYGLRLAARASDPEELISLSKVTLDDRPKIDRSTIPTGDSLRGLGYNSAGDYATRIVASVSTIQLGIGDKHVRMEGSDAISLSLPYNPHQLLDCLSRIKKMMSDKPTDISLQTLEQFVPVGVGAQRSKLNRELVNAIIDPSRSRLAVVWPHEMNEEYGRASAFRVTHGEITEGCPSLGDLLSSLNKERSGGEGALTQDNVEKLLKNRFIVRFDSSDGSPVSPKIPISKWISFEVDIDSVRYFYFRGEWYSLNEGYSRIIAKQVEEIFSREAPIMIDTKWKKGQTEAEFNFELAQQLGGICLDSRLVKGDLYRNPIEVCDVLLPNGTFIHVKNASSSAPVSHLLSQAYISIDAVRKDPSLRLSLKELLEKQGVDLTNYSLTPSKIIIVIAKEKRAITPESLFTFSQINLVRHFNEVESSGNTKMYIISLLKE